MSFNSKKHIILIFSILLMLVIVPTSFASDINDDGYVNTSADDMIISASAGDVNASVSASADTDDVLSSGENVIITANKNTINDYTPGNSESIKVSVSKDDDFDYYYYSGTVYVYAKLNDGSNYDKSTWLSVNSGSSTTFDLNKIDSSYFNSGENTLTFYPYNLNSALTYSPATVTINVAGGSSEPVDESQIYVDGSGAATGTGSESSPFKTLGEAITKANTLDESTIHIADGTYTECGFSLTKSMTIVGSGMDKVIIDAQKKNRIFDITGSAVRVEIQNLTFKNSLASGTTITGSGGAIRAGQSATSTYNQVNLILNNVKFEGNNATQGGAVYISHGQALATTKPINNLIVNDCIFSNNVASGHAGALYTRANTNISKSIFTNNKLIHSGNSGNQYGGAIYIYHSYMTLNVNGSVFENNSATGKGGALFYAGPSSSSIKYNAFINNTASFVTASVPYNVDYGISASNEANIKKMDLDNNWWGYNNVNFTKEIAYSSSLSLKYAQAKLTVDSSEITTKENSLISTSFIWNDETTENIDNLPSRTVKLTSDGDLTETEGNMGLTSTFSASKAGTYYVSASIDNELLSTNIEVTQAEEELTGDWYVSVSGSDSNDGKSRETAFSTVYKALQSASAGDTIVVTQGTYLRPTVTSISKSITIIGDGEVNLTRSAGAYFSSSGSPDIVLKGLNFVDCDASSGFGATTMPAALNLVQTGGQISIINCKFINNKGPSIIRTRSNTVINGCTFIDNTAIGNTNTYSTTYTDGFIDFSASSGKTLTMNYNIFINPIYQGSNKFIVSNGGTGNIDYNYWGSDNPITNFDSSKFTLNNYVVVNSAINSTPIEINNNYNILVSFNSTTDGNALSTLTESMPDLTMDVLKNIGIVDAETITLSDNKATVIYTASNEGEETVSFNYGDNEITSLSFTVEEADDGSKLYVDANAEISGDGSKDNPFKTIKEAIDLKTNKEIIVLEGLYRTDSQFNIESNVIITGRGKVILTSSASDYLFYSSGAYSLTLNNLVIENVTGVNSVIYCKCDEGVNTGTSDSVTYNNLTITNCVFNNNGGYYLIKGDTNTNLNVTQTSFTNNDISYLISMGSSGQYLNVNYCVFMDNSVSYNVYTERESNVDLSYNFWGSNDGASKVGSASYYNTDKYVIVDVSFDESVHAEIDNTLNVKFESNDNSELINLMPITTLSLSSENGVVSENVTLTNNVGTAIYSNLKEGKDSITVYSNVNITKLEFTVEEDVTGKLFVDQTYTGGDSDGSKTKPYTTIKAALDAAKTSDANQIIIFDGIYEDLPSKEYILSKDIALIGRGGNVVIKNLDRFTLYSSVGYTSTFYNMNITGITFTGDSSGTNGMFYDTGTSGDIKTLRIFNCTFKEINAKSLVYVNRHNVILEKVNVIDSVFTAATTSSGAIYLGNSNPSLDISYSNFVNNTFGKYLAYSYSSKVTADYNFWENNNKPNSTLLSPNVLNKVNNWVVLVPEINNETIYKDNDYTINFKLLSTTDGITFEELNDYMPTVSFDLLSALGNTINPTAITMVNNKANVTYTANNGGDEIINITRTNFITNLTFTVEASLIDTSLTVDPSELTLTVGDSAIITATVVPSDLTPSFSSSNVSVVTVDADGNVVAVGAGSAVVTVSVGDGVTYAVNSTTVAVTVRKSTSIVGSDNDGKVMDVGMVASWDVFLDPDDAGSLVFDIADPSIISINDGQITGLKVGTTTVNASFAGNGEYAGVYKIIEVTVNIIDTNLTVDPSELTLTVGDGAVITATTVPSDLTPSFSSSNVSVVTVDADGNVVAVGAGSAVVTVSVGDGATYAINTTTVTVSVSKKEEYAGIIYVDKKGSNENDGSEDKPVATIERAIELATSEINTAHKIIIREGTYEESGLIVSSDLEIVGENAVIDALYDGRILEITGGNVKISGITFTNANVSDYGGAISINGAAVEIDDCIFVNNTATSGAGAILWNADNGKLSNSIFENNAGRNGAAVAIGELGWSPKGDNTLISNCVFNNNDNLYNAAGCIGLAVYADDVKVINSNFTNNNGQINTNHGSLYITGDNAEVYGCLFENNTMDGAGALQADGDYVNIHDNVFKNNIISGGIASRAGAIELQSINAEITNNIFIGNGGDDCSEGGAINIVYVDYDGEILISGNTFINNSAAYGGAIYIDGGYMDYYNEFTITIDNNIFDSNTAGQGAGIYTFNTGDTVVVISNNEFKNQMATEGGAVYSYDSYIELSDNVMDNCTALENGNDIYLEYGEITSTVTLTVSDDATINLGDNITVTAVLTDDNGNTVSGGVITLTANGNTLDDLDVVNGTVSVVFAPNAAGNYTISGSYDLVSDVSVESITVQVIEVISKLDANISAAANDTHIAVTLPADATGNVTVTIGTVDYNSLINNGRAIVAIPELASGNYTANIIYSGDDKYNNDTSSFEFTVPEKQKENPTFTIDVNEVTEGENATIIIKLPNDATGNVSVASSTVPVINGTASVVIFGLPAGNNNLPVTYSGDDKYNAISTSVNVTVNPKEDVTISADSVTIVEGENATITISLSGNATGNISVGNIISTVENGWAVVTMSGLFVGTYTFNIVYHGDSKHNPANSTVVVTVNPKPTFIVEALDVEKYYGGSERFRVKVTDLEGKPISGQLVVITIGERQYNKTTNANGTATAPLGLNSGLYNVTVKVNSTIVNSTALIKSTVEGRDILMIHKNGSQYLATFKDTQGNYLAADTVIQFNINGVLYERNVRSNGTARLNLNLEPGTYVITALNTKTGERCSNNITILSSIIENRDITKLYRNGTQYTVKVLGKDGNPIGSGVNVTFNINGLFYTRTTNNQSIAKMNINLQPGDYVITADYNGCKVSNKITVLPVLSAKDLNKVYGTPDQFIANLVDGQGNPLAGEKVSFNINGMVYERTTNTNGQAKLNIKLQAGEYIITSSYKGANIANKVTVTA